MKLRMTRRMRTYTNVTDADIAQQLADEHGLQSDVDVDGPQYDVVTFFEHRAIPLAINHCVSLYPSEDYQLELNQIDCPTMIVWGDQDPFVSPKLADRLADTVPGSRLVRLPGTGRLVPEEAPDTLTNMILEFVGAAGMLARTD